MNIGTILRFITGKNWIFWIKPVFEINNKFELEKNLGIFKREINFICLLYLLNDLIFV